MKLSQVTYAATINLGNFESKRLELKYDIEEGDTIDKVREDALNHFQKEAELSNVKESSFFKKGRAL